MEAGRLARPGTRFLDGRPDTCSTRTARGQRFASQREPDRAIRPPELQTRSECQWPQETDREGRRRQQATDRPPRSRTEEEEKSRATWVVPGTSVPVALSALSDIHA